MNQQQKDLYMASIYTARANGEIIQVLIDDEWQYLRVGKIDSYYSFKLRIKPKTRIINGYEVPDCLHEEPKDQETTFIESINSADYFYSVVWDLSLLHDKNYLRGICHATKEGAIASCKARLGIDPNE